MEDLLPLFAQQGLPPSLRDFLQQRFTKGRRNEVVHLKMPFRQRAVPM